MRGAKARFAGLGLAAALLALAQPAASLAARSPLDLSFGEAGIELTPASGYLEEGEINALAQDAQGRIIAAGENSVEEFALLRYRADGSLDPTFRGDNPHLEGGFVTTGFGGEAVARAVAIQPDGKIIAAGSNSQGSGPLSLGMFALVRYRPDGYRDPSFGRNGRVLHDLPGFEDGGASAIGLQSDGRIVTGGFHENHGGGTEGLLVRFKPNGVIDRSFGHAGEAALRAGRKGHVWVTAMRVLPDDRVLVVGEWNGRFLLARLLPNGRPDPSFGEGDGRVVTDVDGACDCGYADALSLWRGHILVAGNSIEHGHRFAILARYRANGTLDRSFGARGIVRVHRGTDLAVESIALSADGRITLPGYYATQKAGGPQVAALRLLPSGKPDRSFGRSGLFTHNYSRGGVALVALAQPDGKVIIAGRAAVKPPHFPESESALDGAQFMLMRFLGG